MACFRDAPAKCAPRPSFQSAQESRPMFARMAVPQLSLTAHSRATVGIRRCAPTCCGGRAVTFTD
jgi:hypothetical protein